MTKSPLDYATGPRRRPNERLWRRLIRRLLTRRAAVALGVILALTGAFMSYRWPWVWYGSRRAYDWHRMLTLKLPPGRVVYEEDPARAQELLARPPERSLRDLKDPRWRDRRDYYWSHWSYLFDTSRRVARFHPPFYRPECWVGNGGGDLVFMHERTSMTETRRLVWAYSTSINGEQGYPRNGLRISAQSQPINPPFLLGEPARRHLIRAMEISLRPDQIMRLYAGQADPNDAAHFTIKYEINNLPGTIDGRLEADDTVTLRLLDGPAATRPSARP